MTNGISDSKMKVTPKRLAQFQYDWDNGWISEFLRCGQAFCNRFDITNYTLYNCQTKTQALEIIRIYYLQEE